MFRRGGNVGTGIMSGVVDRTRHADDGGPVMDKDYEKIFMEKIIGAGGMPQGMDPLTSYLLAAGPQIAKSTSWADMIGNLEGPNKGLIEQQNKKAEWERNLKTGAAEFGLTQDMKRDILSQEEAGKDTRLQKQIDAGRFDTNKSKGNYDLWFGVYADRFEDDVVAENAANFQITGKRDMIEKGVPPNQIGGVLETNPKDMDKSKLKRLSKKQGGMYFYDPFSGETVRLDKIGNEWKFIKLDVDYKPLIGGDTDTSITEISEVKLSRPDAEAEAQKRGLVLLPDAPEDASRGWLSTQKRNNPDAITIVELQEIIEKENFAERYKHLKNKSR